MLWLLSLNCCRVQREGIRDDGDDDDDHDDYGADADADNAAADDDGDGYGDGDDVDDKARQRRQVRFSVVAYDAGDAASRCWMCW